MIADFSADIATFGEPITRRRRSQGFSSFGVHTPGDETATTITATVVRGLETQELLPQGEQTGEVITIYTSDDLRTVSAPDGALADLVEYEGETYEVRGVHPWRTHGNFLEAAAVKVAQ